MVVCFCCLGLCLVRRLLLVVRWCCSLFVGWSLFVNVVGRCVLLVVCVLLLFGCVSCLLMLEVVCCALAIGCCVLLVIVRCWLFLVPHCRLFVVCCCVLFVVCCWLSRVVVR